HAAQPALLPEPHAPHPRAHRGRHLRGVPQKIRGRIRAVAAGGSAGVGGEKLNAETQRRRVSFPPRLCVPAFQKIGKTSWRSPDADLPSLLLWLTSRA